MRQAFSLLSLWNFIFTILHLYGSGSEIDASSTFHIDRAVKRVYAHIAIGDYVSACREAEEAFVNVKMSSMEQSALREAYIKALAKAGDEKAMSLAWGRYRSLYPEIAATNRDLQEAMAWGTIAKGSQSSSPVIRLAALIAAFFSADAKGVALIEKHCDDSNILVRGMAMRLCSQFRDAALCEKVIAKLQSESSWKVRLEAVKSAGAMKIKNARSLLMAFVANPKTPQEEKIAATHSIVEQLDAIGRRELESLIYSDRAGLRFLGCQVIAHLRSLRDIDLLSVLISDRHPEVRAAALRCAGFLNIKVLGAKSLVSIAMEARKDPAPEVAITAAWLLVLLESECAEEAFLHCLRFSQRDARIAAAAALAATGHRGVPLMLKYFHLASDPFIKMNLALGLIKEQKAIFEAATVLHRGLLEDSARWMWTSDKTFTALAPSSLKYDDGAGNPEEVNQLVRLEILNLLAIVKFPHVDQAIKHLLKQKHWGITGIAAALLLAEGDLEALESVESLLEDPDPLIQLQAALALSLWGRDEKAIAVLESHYASSSRETKEHILESIGHIGSISSVPFLIEVLKEPQQILRIIAAGSLLRCLYH